MTDRPDLVIVGAGGFARETAAAVRATTATGAGWRLLGFLDDDPALPGTHRSGLPILGGTEQISALGEAAVVGVVGAAIGLVLGWVAVNILQNLEALRGYFVPTWEVGVFARSLYFALGVAILGALYPAVRAAFISPLEALRRE